jgi:hypothetical protein
MIYNQAAQRQYRRGRRRWFQHCLRGGITLSLLNRSSIFQQFLWEKVRRGISVLRVPGCANPVVVVVVVLRIIVRPNITVGLRFLAAISYINSSRPPVLCMFVNQIHQRLILEGDAKGTVSIDAMNTSTNPTLLALGIDVSTKAELLGLT